MCVRKAIALKPANLTFEQAAAVPTAAITARQDLRDHGRIQSGHTVLINGAMGEFALLGSLNVSYVFLPFISRGGP